MDKLHELVVLQSGESLPAFEWRAQRVKKKIRHIAVPNEPMRRLHKRLMARLMTVANTQYLFKSAYGSVKNRSAIGNAAQHIFGTFFYQLDIANAFPSVDVDRLAEVLCMVDSELGTLQEVKNFLETYCAHKRGGLATGAPASPLLFNIYCAILIDQPLRALFKDPRNTYTRYIDDLTISSWRPIPGVLRRKVREIITAVGFQVNHRKSSITDRRESSVTITGATITRRGKLRPTDEYMRRVAEALRKPVEKMTSADAYSFSGLASFLCSFGRSDFGRLHSELPWHEVSEEVWAMAKRCEKRLVILKQRGLLTSTPSAMESKRIPEWFIEQLRMLAPIEEVVSWYVKLKKRPRSSEWVGLSPFNREKTPSFMVAPQKLFFHDFSSGIHGTIFDMVMRMEKVSFPKAVCLIAERYGVEIPT